jgi:uncharacterized protein (DUF58 family)
MALTGRAAAAAVAGALLMLGAAVAAEVAAPSAATRTVVFVMVVVDGAVVACVLADIALAAPVRPLRMARAGDTMVRLGESAAITITIENPGRRLRGVLRDAWPPSAGAHPHHVPIDIPAGGRARAGVTLTPQRRGDRKAAMVTVRSYGPFRLGARQGRHDVPWTLRVMPPFASRRYLPEKLARLRELDGQHRALLRGQGSEFDSLREYVLGDDVRSIDWRGSARRAEVVVRTWRPERDRRLLIVLDTGRTSAGRVGGLPRLDCGMDAALLLGALAARAGDRVDLIAFDRRIRARVQGAARAQVLPALVQAMAPLEAELIESDWSAMASAILGHARRRCLVVLLTDLNAAAIHDGLLPRLPALTARHMLLLAAVADPRTDEMAVGRGDAALVYDAAAAEHARSQRAEVSAVLRRKGVEVIDAPPERLPAALADTYLALKAAGRL